MRQRYLIAYDVADDKRRNAVFKALIDSGDHVQYSVFLCQLSKVELAALKGRLMEAINHKHDQVILLDLGPADSDLQSRLACMGKTYLPPTRVNVI